VPTHEYSVHGSEDEVYTELRRLFGAFLPEAALLMKWDASARTGELDAYGARGRVSVQAGVEGASTVHVDVTVGGPAAMFADQIRLRLQVVRERLSARFPHPPGP
jgi:hypothetical protein